MTQEGLAPLPAGALTQLKRNMWLPQSLVGAARAVTATAPSKNLTATAGAAKCAAADVNWDGDAQRFIKRATNGRRGMFGHYYRGATHDAPHAVQVSLEQAAPSLRTWRLQITCERTALTPATDFAHDDGSTEFSLGWEQRQGETSNIERSLEPSELLAAKTGSAKATRWLVQRIVAMHTLRGELKPPSGVDRSEREFTLVKASAATWDDGSREDVELKVELVKVPPTDLRAELYLTAQGDAPPLTAADTQARAARIAELTALASRQKKLADEAGAELRAVAPNPKSLRVNDFGTLKSLAKPPAGVDDVVQAVAILLAPEGADLSHARYRTWGAMKSMMSDKNLIDHMSSLDIDRIPPRSLEAVRPLLGLDHFNLAVLRKRAAVAAGMCEWVIGTVSSHDVLQNVKPILLQHEATVKELEELQTALVPMASKARAARIVELREEKALAQAAEEHALRGLRRVQDELGSTIYPLKMADLTELKHLVRMPHEVKIVMEALVILLAPARCDLSQLDTSPAEGMKLLGRIAETDKNNLLPRNVDAVRPLLAKEDFSVEHVMARSKSAAGLCHWVIHIVRYHDLFEKARPTLQRRLALDAELRLLERPIPMISQARDARIAELRTERVQLAEQVAEAKRSLQPAAQALSSLDLVPVEELKSLPNVPAGIDDVLAAVHYMLAPHGADLSQLDLSWKGTLKLMARADFAAKLTHRFDKAHIPPANVAAVGPLLKLPHFTEEAFRAKSHGAGTLARWVLLACQYHEILQTAKPVLQRQATIQAELEFLSKPTPRLPPPPLTFTGAELPLREWGVLAADRASEAQLAIWVVREAKWGPSATMPEKRWKRERRRRTLPGQGEVFLQDGFFPDLNAHGVAFIGRPFGAAERAADAVAANAVSERRAEQALCEGWVVWPEARSWGEPGWGKPRWRRTTAFLFLEEPGQREPGAWRKFADRPSQVLGMARAGQLKWAERPATGAATPSSRAAPRRASQKPATAAMAEAPIADSVNTAQDDSVADGFNGDDDDDGAWDAATPCGVDGSVAGAEDAGWTPSKWTESLGLHASVSAALQPLLPADGEEAFQFLTTKLQRAELEAALAEKRLDGLAEPLWNALVLLRSQAASSGAALASKVR